MLEVPLRKRLTQTIRIMFCRNPSHSATSDLKPDFDIHYRTGNYLCDLHSIFQESNRIFTALHGA